MSFLEDTDSRAIAKRISRIFRSIVVTVAASIPASSPAKLAASTKVFLTYCIVIVEPPGPDRPLVATPRVALVRAKMSTPPCWKNLGSSVAITALRMFGLMSS